MTFFFGFSNYSGERVFPLSIMFFFYIFLYLNLMGFMSFSVFLTCSLDCENGYCHGVSKLISTFFVMEMVNLLSAQCFLWSIICIFLVLIWLISWV